jgi:cation diffusion facilitator CzcD-associated flavoprotein CzcO
VSASTRVVIVGAGQAGLSVGYHLRRLGLRPGTDFVMLDRGPGTGGSWQFRWESLRLDKTHRVSDLPGMPELGVSFATADQTLAARDVVADYYARYEQHFGLEVIRPANVTSVLALANGHLLVEIAPVDSTQVETTAASFETEVLVNASGTWATPFRPYYPHAESFRGIQISTPEYRAAEDFAGKHVVVVGGGTSATGFLLELENVAAKTSWVTRRPVHFTDNPEGGINAVAAQDVAARAGLVSPSIVSGTDLPASDANLAAEARGVLVARPMFETIEPTGVRFPDGSFEEADAIIWATGFRADLGHLAPLKLREHGGGIRVEAGQVTGDPRIFLAGYGPQASTIGANRAGRLVAKQVMERLRQPAASGDAAVNE